MAKLIEVDTRNTTVPHTRHRAVVNRVVRPYEEKESVRLLNSEVALTICGKILRNYWDATQISLYNTEGGVYSVECPACFDCKDKRVIDAAAV